MWSGGSEGTSGLAVEGAFRDGVDSSWGGETLHGRWRLAVRSTNSSWAFAIILFFQAMV